MHAHALPTAQSFPAALGSRAALGHVHLVGVDMKTATKLVYTLALVAALVVLRLVARQVVRLALRGRTHTTVRFWSRQAINLATGVVFILGVLSIWFDNGLHAAAAVGLLSAGLAFALQKAVTSLAGYFLILRGDVFSIGDRVVMGGVRGDVIGLGFLRTTILEMGQPEGDTDTTGAAPVWVDARQHTGRVVTVTNGVVFDEPVYNYSRDFPFLWEELRVGIPYDADRKLAERILLEVATRHAPTAEELDPEALQRMRRRFYLPRTDVEPEVFYKLTSNWVELAVRFVVPVRGIRRVKSDISRDLLDEFERAGLEIATTSFAVSGLPELRMTTPEGAPPYPSH